MMLAEGLSHMAFIMLRYLPTVPLFLRFFYHEWMLNFVECFFSIHGDMVFVLLFVDVVDDDDGFSNIVPSLHPWNKFYLMMDDLFDVFLDLVC